MALSTKKLSDLRREVTIPFDGDTITVTYRLASINSKLFDWVDEKGADRRAGQEWLTRVVVDWDILEEDGSHLPVTVEAMDKYDIPAALFAIIRLAIQEDASPNALRASYKSGSPLTSGIALNGTP